MNEEIKTPKKYHYHKKPGRRCVIDRISLDKVKKLTLAGWTDLRVAEFFGLTASALYAYKAKHPDFFESIKEWKKEADKQVERSLYERACGYYAPAVKFFQHGKEILKQEYIEFYPPDTTAMIFWLKNRQPKDWKDRSEIDLGLKENLVEKFQNLKVNELVERADAIFNRSRASSN